MEMDRQRGHITRPAFCQGKAGKKTYFSTKIYVVGTQKDHLNETVLLSIQNVSENFWVSKYSNFTPEILCLPMTSLQ